RPHLRWPVGRRHAVDLKHFQQKCAAVLRRTMRQTMSISSKVLSALRRTMRQANRSSDTEKRRIALSPGNKLLAVDYDAHAERALFALGEKPDAAAACRVALTPTLRLVDGD